MDKKLIIWDFDGVIADTESLLVSVKMNAVNKYLGLNWDFVTTHKILGGISDKDKQRVLAKMGIVVDDDFWVKITNKCNYDALLSDVKITPNIIDIFNMKNFDQCIATGGAYKITEKKLKKTGVDKYFDKKDIFTIDLVDYGKPAPDLFLLAAKTKGYKPEDCFVIEDSKAGLTAAIRAEMTPIAFVKYNSDYINNEIKKLGIKNIFYDMNDIKSFLINNL